MTGSEIAAGKAWIEAELKRQAQERGIDISNVEWAWDMQSGNPEPKLCFDAGAKRQAIDISEAEIEDCCEDENSKRSIVRERIIEKLVAIQGAV